MLKRDLDRISTTGTDDEVELATQHLMGIISRSSNSSAETSTETRQREENEQYNEIVEQIKTKRTNLAVLKELERNLTSFSAEEDPTTQSTSTANVQENAQKVLKDLQDRQLAYEATQKKRARLQSFIETCNERLKNKNNATTLELTSLEKEITGAITSLSKNKN